MVFRIDWASSAVNGMASRTGGLFVSVNGCALSKTWIVWWRMGEIWIPMALRTHQEVPVLANKIKVHQISLFLKFFTRKKSPLTCEWTDVFPSCFVPSTSPLMSIQSRTSLNVAHSITSRHEPLRAQKTTTQNELKVMEIW